MRKTTNYTPDINYGHAERVRFSDRTTPAQNESKPEKWPGWARGLFMITAATLLWGLIFWATYIVFN